MTPEEISVILSGVSAAVVAIQVYLVYRIERAKLKLESYLGISEKSELEIKPEIQSGPNEVIKIINKGLITIDEIEATIDILVNRKNKQDLPLHLKWGRKTLLSPKEGAVVPLYERLFEFFKKNKLMTLEAFEFPSEDPVTGDDIMDTDYAPRLVQSFSIILDIGIEAKIQGQVKTMRKKFRLAYDFKLFPSSVWEGDYEILINEHMGEWLEVTKSS